MSKDDSIVETMKEEVSEAAKAVVAEVKSIAHEVVDAITEGTGSCGRPSDPAQHDTDSNPIPSPPSKDNQA